MYGYVYKTTNQVNHKIYIGQHHSETFDESYKGSGKLILKAFKKYGFENFSCEVLEWCETFDELNDREIYYISKYCVEPGMHYNIASGGHTGNGHYFKTEEENRIWSERISKARKGQKRSLESRRKQSETNKGHVISEETRRKISAAKKGNTVINEYTRMRVAECTRERTPWNKGSSKAMNDSLVKQGITHSKNWGTRKKITKDGVLKCVRVETIPEYINDGWRLVNP